MFSVLLAVMFRFFGDNGNTSGAAAVVAFIFLYSGCDAMFFNSTVRAIVFEILSQHLRVNHNSLALFSISVTNSWLAQITPVLLDSLA